MKKIISATFIFVLSAMPLLTLAEEASSQALPVCDPNTELIINGGFEHPVVTDEKKWSLFDWSTAGLGWTPSINAYALEIQAGYTEDSLPWAPYAGNQYAEIDGGNTLQVFQNVPTIVGATYTISFAYSARPHVAVPNNQTSIIANGSVLGTVSADGATATNTAWVLQEYDFVATSTMTAFGLWDTSDDTVTGGGMFIDAVSVKCADDNGGPVIPPINTPPVLTLLGDNPMSIIVDTVFVDPGATSTDAEDGDLTSSIIRSGTVNASSTGSYTLTYTVSDSDGSTVSANRVVNVIPFIITHTCLLPTTFGDGTVEPVLPGSDSLSLQDIFNAKGINKNVITDQKQYQAWEVQKDNTNIRVEFIEGHPNVASLASVFGYYVNGNIATFTPIFRSGDHTDFASTTLFAVGQSTTTSIGNVDKVGFAIKTNAIPGNTWASENSINGGDDYMTAYELDNNVYMIAFEDLALSSSDKDYNDMIVKITVSDCADDTEPPTEPVRPSITLGANPSSITIGATSTLVWTSTNTNSCSADWTNATSTSGSQDVLPATTTDYAMTCTGGNGSVSATTTITVNPISTTTPPVDPPVTPPTTTGGGGGGGEGGGIGGRRHDISNLLSTGGGQILGATSCYYLRDFLKQGWDNDNLEMLKLQTFLNVFEGENLSLTSVFDDQTFSAVERLQNKYFGDILEPWGHTAPTGFVYILTKKKVNEIYCKALFPVTAAEQEEINSFHDYLELLRSRGVNIDGTFVPGDVIGVSPASGEILTGIAIGENGEVVDSTGSPVVKLEPIDPKIAEIPTALRNAAVTLFAYPKNTLILWGGVLIAILAIIFSGIGRGDKKMMATKAGDRYEVDNSLLGITNPDAGSENQTIILGAASDEGKPAEMKMEEPYLPEEEIVIENENENENEPEL